jgi:hypothetical protein
MFYEVDVDNCAHQDPVPHYCEDCEDPAQRITEHR